MHLILAHEARFPKIPFFIPTTSLFRQGLREWFENLPKTIWEIGIKDPGATTRILEFLLVVGQRGPESMDGEYSILPRQVFGVVAARLGPWFWLDHPTKGGIKGPWTKLDREVKKAGLDVARIWGMWDAEGGLKKAVSQAVEGDQWAKAYWSSRSS
jgi:pre-rRNA-processing protein IPI1